jgi:hypothetical protein
MRQASLFRSYYGHHAVFYRGVESPASFSFRSIFAYRRAPAQAATEFTEPDFALLSRAFNRARALHPFYLTAWVFLPHHWHGIFNEYVGMNADESVSQRTV